MKILFTSSSFGGGGITSYAHEFIRCFMEYNELSVIIGNDDCAPINYKGVAVYKYELNKDLSLNNSTDVLNLINHKICPDVMINSNAILISLISPYINNQVRIITISHSLRYDEADIAGYNAQYLDKIIALSNYSKQYICSQYAIDDYIKVRVVYNFVDAKYDVPLLLEKKKQTDILNIVYAGGGAPSKSPELIYKIIRGLINTNKKFKFIFMGDDRPVLHSIQNFQSISEILPTDERIKFTGRLSRSESEKVISEANVFLIPSRREGCPMAMLEAMRCGAVIVTTDYNNACREMIINGKNGFIIKHNQYKKIIDRILDIIDNHQKYYRYYDECYKTYQKYYSRQVWISQMNNIILEKDENHQNRMIDFDKQKYLQDVKWWVKREKYNKYHSFFFETLRPALFFYMEYLKNKITD